MSYFEMFNLAMYVSTISGVVYYALFFIDRLIFKANQKKIKDGRFLNEGDE